MAISAEPAAPARHRALRLALLAAGVAAAGWLIAAHDPGAILGAVAALGWGLAAIAAFRLLPIAVDALAWRALVAPPRPAMARFVVARWIGESVNALLPVAQVGGDVARARALARSGVAGPQAAASVAVDFALGLGAQAAFAAVGLAIVLAVRPAGGWEGPALAVAALGVLGGLAVAAVGRAGAAGRASRAVPAGLRRLFGAWPWAFTRIAPAAESLAGEVRALGGARGRLAGCLVGRFLGWFVRAGENWLILLLLGGPASLVVPS